MMLTFCDRFAAPFIDWITPEYAMPFGALTYGIWIATYYAGWSWFNILGAAIFGWGAGIMWPAAGQLLATISTPHNRGSNNGIFLFGHVYLSCLFISDATLMLIRIPTFTQH
jgi:hypothetical protein